MKTMQSWQKAPQISHKQAQDVLQLGLTAAMPSPCVGLCRMSATPLNTPPLCLGCARTLNEITAWSQATPAKKREVWTLIAQRLEMINHHVHGY